MRWPRDHDTDQSFCPRCGEPTDLSPNVEAWETFGEILCEDCAEALFEEEADANTLRLANPLEPKFRRLG